MLRVILPSENTYCSISHVACFNMYEAKHRSRLTQSFRAKHIHDVTWPTLIPMLYCQAPIPSHKTCPSSGTESATVPTSAECSVLPRPLSTGTNMATCKPEEDGFLADQQHASHLTSPPASTPRIIHGTRSCGQLHVYPAPLPYSPDTCLQNHTAQLKPCTNQCAPAQQHNERTL